MTMAKEETPPNEFPSLEDFYEENLLDNLDQDDPDEEEEEIIQDEEEEEEDIPAPPSKKKSKPKEEDEEEDEDEDPPEEEEEEDKSKEKDEEEEEEDLTPEGLFWDDVEKITGVKVDVDYNGVDPETPEGAALREQAVADSAISGFIEEMKEKMPKVYRVFEHALAGGSPDELYRPGEKDYSSIEIKDDDEDFAKSIAQEYYQKKGLPSSRISKLIEIDEDSEEGIIKTAKGYLKEMTEAQETERAARAEKQRQQEDEQRQKDQTFLASVDEVLKKGKVGSFVLPKKEATEFYDFVRTRIQRDGKGGYVTVTPVDAKELEQQLQYEYFRYKKGDLDKLIQDKAKTTNTRKLKKTIQKSSQKAKSNSTGGTSRTTPKTLKDFEE